MNTDLWFSVFDNVNPSTRASDIVIATASVVVFVSTWHPSVQRMLTRRSQHAVGLPLPASLTDIVRLRQVRRVRAFIIGGLAGLLISTAFVWFVGADRSSPALLMLLCGFAVCGALGTSIAALVGEATRSNEGVRVAHLSRRQLSDYVPRWERVLVWTAVALSTALVVLLALLTAFADLRLSVFPESFSVAALLTCLAVLALGAFELGGRLIIGRRQATESELELAWDDSLRSGAIRDLLTAAFLLGAAGIGAGITEIGLAIVVQFDGNSMPPTAMDVVLAAAILMAFIARSRRRSPGQNQAGVESGLRS
ncbi:hypothetical protein GCM10022381_37320 [Leifsonia kafniensis]|uniref:ABC transporter permease n=1 Tax=Leifsonia kafniensis TaxID=475957 RepID=A0ABP7L327_9MICO